MCNAFIWQQAYKGINGTLTQPCTCHMKALKGSAEINLGNEWDTKDWMEPTHRINTWLKLLYWIQDIDGESHEPAVSPDWNNNEILFFPRVFFFPPLLSLARGYFKWDFHSANRLAERRVFHGHPSLHTPLISSHWLPMRFVNLLWQWLDAALSQWGKSNCCIHLPLLRGFFCCRLSVWVVISDVMVSQWWAHNVT